MNRRRAGRLAVDRGRASERDVARRLSAWAGGLYAFHRGLGHKSIEDLVVEGGPPAWPFTISVKSERGPSLAGLLERAAAGQPMPWWPELEHAHVGRGVTHPEALAADRARAWLIWRSGSTRRWLLSCWSLGANQTPVRMMFLPTPAGWPRFTMQLDAFLDAVTIEQAIAAIADGWGQP